MAKKNSLTKEQMSLVKDLDKTCKLFCMDYRDVSDYPEKDRTRILRATKDRIIRGIIVRQYTVIDTALNIVFYRYFFPLEPEESYAELWKTQKFQKFNQYILEQLFLRQKLRFVRTIIDIPTKAQRRIDAINELRNALTHAYFPGYPERRRIEYRKKNIFMYEGLQMFLEDSLEVGTFFHDKFEALGWLDTS